jgi:hypothetical protein
MEAATGHILTAADNPHFLATSGAAHAAAANWAASRARQCRCGVALMAEDNGEVDVTYEGRKLVCLRSSTVCQAICTERSQHDVLQKFFLRCFQQVLGQFSGADETPGPGRLETISITMHRGDTSSMGWWARDTGGVRIEAQLLRLTGSDFRFGWTLQEAKGLSCRQETKQSFRGGVLTTAAHPPFLQWLLDTHPVGYNQGNNGSPTTQDIKAFFRANKNQRFELSLRIGFSSGGAPVPVPALHLGDMHLKGVKNPPGLLHYGCLAYIFDCELAPDEAPAPKRHKPGLGSRESNARPARSGQNSATVIPESLPLYR